MRQLVLASETCYFSYHRPSVAFMRHLRNCPKTNGKQIGTQFHLVLNITIVNLAQFNEPTLVVRGKCHKNYTKSMYKVLTLSAVCDIKPTGANIWRSPVNVLESRFAEGFTVLTTS